MVHCHILLQESSRWFNNNLEWTHEVWPQPQDMAGQMFVVKRDGRSQEVKFDNITQRIRNLCDGLDPRFIDPVPVTQKVVEGAENHPFFGGTHL